MADPFAAYRVKEETPSDAFASFRTPAAPELSQDEKLAAFISHNIERGLPLLPTIGGTFGGSFGGAGGESIRQIGEHLFGLPSAPQTSEEAMKRMAMQGLTHFGFGFGSGLLKEGAKAGGKALVKAAGSKALKRGGKSLPQLLAGAVSLPGGLDPSDISRALVTYGLTRAATNPATVRAVGQGLASRAGSNIIAELPRWIYGLLQASRAPQTGAFEPAMALSQ